MGVFDKIKFWKKDEFELPADLPPPAEIPGVTPSGVDVPSMERPPAFGSDFPQEQSLPSQQGLPQAFASPVSSRPQFAQQSQPQFSSAPQFNQQPPSFAPISQDQQLALISSKLDTVKAQLETVLQRLDRLERRGEERPYEQRWKSMM